ncbi:MAG TPA: DUF4295 family protein [Bacteroidia bacterium]|nr:DUF4295 domain-containing protein [Sphingobacteriales bacterium]HPD64917.1 DUF4295 family protein [Bacteroidia bacterium]HRS58368.1 DUF4295 family protein [Bacteroidia bacterium]HRU67318.1 DUF4295 family protein [Bacteroidia bacterium]
MAKKVVAGLKKATNIVKVISPVKSQKTGKYRFKVDVIDKEELSGFLAKKK